MNQLEYEPDPPADSPRTRPTVAAPMPARPLRYAVRMAVFLVAVGIVAALLREQAAPFFMRNPPLNSLILSILVLGIILSFRAVLSLDPEVMWLQRFRHQVPGISDGAPPLLRPLASMLGDPAGRLRLSATGVRSVLDGVDSRLDERRDTSRYVIALLIFLGLLGTFWGLLMTASSVGETIRGLNVTGSDPAQMFETLRAGLEAPLSGMGTAFSTSLFGLASSLVVGFLDLQASQAQTRFANDLEAWLSSLVRLDGGAAWDEGERAPTYLTALLEQTVENLDELRGRMTRAMEQSTGVNTALRSVGERLSSLADALRARQSSADSALDAQLEMRALLERIASVLETPRGGLDERTRSHLENIDLGLGRLIEEDARGRDRVVTELRNEIRVLARTLAAIVDRGR